VNWFAVVWAPIRAARSMAEKPLAEKVVRRWEAESVASGSSESAGLRKG